MSFTNNKTSSCTSDLLQDLTDRAKEDSKLRNPSLEPSAPLKPAALYEDAGNGFNANFVFPQD